MTKPSNVLISTELAGKIESILDDAADIMPHAEGVSDELRASERGPSPPQAPVSGFDEWWEHGGRCAYIRTTETALKDPDSLTMIETGRLIWGAAQAAMNKMQGGE